MDKGYIITRLEIAGGDRKSSSIIFKEGLNVVSGPSDTGKSFILECIDYMLGSSKSLGKIPEIKGYEFIYLEILTKDLQKYTFKRDLNDSDFDVYSCAFLEIKSESEFFKLSRKHKKDTTETISYFLLSLCNLNGRKLQKNARGDVIELTYRNLSRLFIIPETEVIKKSSPILSGDTLTATSEKSLFRFLITLTDDSNLKKLPGKKVISGKKGKLDMLKKVIKKLGYDSEYWDEQKETRKKEELKRIIDNLHDLNEKHRILNKRLNSFLADKKRITDSLYDLKRQLDTLAINIKRASILDKQYDSDIERLEATIESGYMIQDSNHLENRCLICNSEVLDECYQQNIVGVIEACKLERKKITLLKSELIASKIALNDKEKQLLEKDSNFKTELTGITNIFESDFANNIEDTKLIIKSNYDKKNTLQNEIKNNSDLKSFILEKKDLEKFININSEIINNKHVFKSKDTKDFYVILKDILIGIGFGDFTNKEDEICIDEEAFDLILHGKERKLYGKGYRSILYSAFILALISYVGERNINLGTVIIDSPVLNYKKADLSDIEDDEVKNIGKNLYIYLSTTKVIRQTIILENIEPPEDIKKDINYVYFSKSTKGRYGFIET